MTPHRQSRVLANIVSPYGLAMISYAIFLFSCLLPPSVYMRFMHEPDLMFLNSTAIFFYTICVAGFLAGVWLIGWLFPAGPFSTHKLKTTISPAAFLLIPVIFCTALTALSIILILKNNPLAILLLLSQKGNLLTPTSDASLEFQGTMNISVLFVSGIVWWSTWNYSRFGDAWRGRRGVRIAQWLSVITVLLYTSLIVSKHLFIVLITGLAIAYLTKHALCKRLSWALFGKTTLILSLIGTIVFFLITSLKGAPDIETVGETLFGYTVASYNRFAALLNGQIHFEYTNRGVYFSNFISFNNLFNHIIPYRKALNIPDFIDWWWSEFGSVGRAGLNSSLIFFGAFGEAFLELGWMAPIYICCTGMLYGLIWRSAKEGRLVGIVLYPYFAYCILFWFTTNGLFDQDLVALIIDTALLATYEKIFVKTTRMPSSALQTP